MTDTKTPEPAAVEVEEAVETAVEDVEAPEAPDLERVGELLREQRRAAAARKTYLTLEEAREADEERHLHGVLVDKQILGSEFEELGILALRIVGHDSPPMKELIGKARRRAVREHNQGLASPVEHVHSWDGLPPEGHFQVERDVAAASLRLGAGLELYGDFEALLECEDDDEYQERWLALLDEAPGWVTSGLYRAGAKVLADPLAVTGRMILDSKKKGCACGPPSAPAWGAGGAKAAQEQLLPLQSLISGALRALRTTPSTALQSRGKKTQKRSRSST